MISDSDEELDGEENSELGINNPLLKLYTLYEYKIVEVLAYFLIIFHGTIFYLITL